MSKKGFMYVMLIELIFQQFKKYINILNIQWAMDFWILITIFILPYRTYEYEFLFHNVFNLVLFI
jgi:hypothetical protein